MQADKLNRWLTLGANLGVLFGIMLLVIELDQNREMIRAQTRNDISNQITDFLSMVANNPVLASLKHRAEAGEELTAAEEHQHFLLASANIRMWENIHYQYRHDMFDEEEYLGELSTWRFLIHKDKSFNRTWCLSRTNYSVDFMLDIDKFLPKDACVEQQDE